MRRYMLLAVFTLLCVAGSFAGNGEKFIGIAGGYSFVNALDFKLSYEMDSRYHGSHEIFAEFYDSRKYGSWKYLQEYRGGYAYKYALTRGKNSTFKLRTGAALGADQDGFTCGFQLGFELNRTFGSNIQGFILQKNEYSLFTPRPWRNGLMLGLRFPL